MNVLQWLLRLLPGKTLSWRVFDGCICLTLLAFSIYYQTLSLRQAEPWYLMLTLGDVPATPRMEYSGALSSIGVLCLIVIGVYCFLRRHARYTTCLAAVAALILLCLNATHIPAAPPPLAPGEVPWDPSLPRPDPFNGLFGYLCLAFLLPILSTLVQWAHRGLLSIII